MVDINVESLRDDELDALAKAVEEESHRRETIRYYAKSADAQLRQLQEASGLEREPFEEWEKPMPLMPVTAYGIGDTVTDADGTRWKSNVPNNSYPPGVPAWSQVEN